MNNKSFSQAAAWTAATATLLFGLFMLLPDKTLSTALSCGASLFISIGYLGVACAFAVQASADRKAAAYLGMALACVYTVFINLVYFTQLTTVLHGSAPVEVLDAITYRTGTWFFNLDLFGYGIMSLSTFFIGLSLKANTRSEKWLRSLMLVAGVFAISSILMPLLNVFSGEAGASEDIYGVLVLEFWCLYFIPVMVLAAGYFKKNNKSSSD
ncbi:MAG: hypothetical protein FP831_04430 [Anaerolineae bacterium]|nr:hypothetical protein [Anaerolineae bacterium]